MAAHSGPAGPPDLQARLAGQQIVDIGRRGKYLLIHLDSGATLIVHLRMTGGLEVAPGDSSAVAGSHVRAWFGLADGRCLVFSDPRKFGRIWLVDDLAEVVGKLGPEPLAWDFTAEALAERLAGRRARSRPCCSIRP